ncbi:hypothetical protein HPB47_015020 [Ixodes persulcatus]|uniref:Uncharacterized protein n=1 Tax=Ixodes persulcatus TaxID=34615 RepID=A0AC60QWF5_IXOPE|nr:hypothetical protein HPB47_015020 [Ixodes persulcatus]
MELALLSGASVNGVKGPSPLTDLPHFNLVWGFSVDYMHCVLLGVTRQFTEYLFSSTNCRENYYIGSPSVVVTVNKRLLSIRPPHCVTRLPRPVGDRSFWKASEWRQWLLFYCLPCTLGILDQRYWKHLRCLVEAVYILLLQEFTPGQLDHAEVDFLTQKAFSFRGEHTSRPQCQNGQAMPVRGSRTFSGEEWHSRQNSLERSSSSIGQQWDAPSGSQRQEQRDSGYITPSTSPATSVGGGRGRGFPPRAADLPKPPCKASSEEVEVMDEATDPPPPPVSGHEDMKCQAPNRKSKGKKPVTAPK